MDQKEFFAEATESQRYRLTEVIGKGSYGVVASAVDQFTGEGGDGWASVGVGLGCVQLWRGPHGRASRRGRLHRRIQVACRSTAAAPHRLPATRNRQRLSLYM